MFITGGVQLKKPDQIIRNILSRKQQTYKQFNNNHHIIGFNGPYYEGSKSFF
jgi:hypothetical protein